MPAPGRWWRRCRVPASPLALARTLALSGKRSESIRLVADLRRLAERRYVSPFELALCQFALPFLVLLSRAAKRRPWVLGWLAAGILLVHVVELFWLVVPPLRPTLYVHWLDLAAPLGVGGIWLAAVVWRLSRHPLLPVPQLQAREAFAHEGHEAPGRP